MEQRSRNVSRLTRNNEKDSQDRRSQKTPPDRAFSKSTLAYAFFDSLKWFLLAALIAGAFSYFVQT